MRDQICFVHMAYRLSSLWKPFPTITSTVYRVVFCRSRSNRIAARDFPYFCELLYCNLDICTYKQIAGSIVSYGGRGCLTTKTCSASVCFMFSVMSTYERVSVQLQWSAYLFYQICMPNMRPQPIGLTSSR